MGSLWFEFEMPHHPIASCVELLVPKLVVLFREVLAISGTRASLKEGSISLRDVPGSVWLILATLLVAMLKYPKERNRREGNLWREEKA